MSILLDKKTKVILYVPGLGQVSNYFDKHIEKLTNKDKNNIIVLKEKIEIYNIIENDNSLDAIMSNINYKLSKNLNNLVETIKNNKNKTILVRLGLNSYYDDKNSIFLFNDSINNQSKKLKFFIENLKKIVSDIDIILVGHSQGGLVNLKTAISIPNLIKEIISIATPYSKVYFAKYEYFLNIIQKNFNNIVDFVKTNYKEFFNKYKFFENKKILTDEEKIKIISNDNYIDCVSVLSNPNFFKSLKEKWYKLKKRPKFTLISGVSAHFMTTKTFLIFEENKRYPFDGIVFGKEQVDINSDEKYILGNDAEICYEMSNKYENSCHNNSYELINEHKCNHKLPCFDLGNLIFNIIKNFSISEEKIEIIEAIKDSLKDNKSKFNEKSDKYKRYYEIFGSQYSHKNIQEANEVIDIIYGKLL